MINSNNFSNLVIYSDGGSRGNPGNAGIGYCILDEKKNEIFSHGEYIGLTTNNVAEYQAIAKALEYVLSRDWQIKNIECYLDSELVVKQLSGVYKIKKPHLAKIAMAIKNSIKNLNSKGLEKIVFNHIPRNLNKRADGLVNEAVDSFLQQV